MGFRLLTSKALGPATSLLKSHSPSRNLLFRTIVSKPELQSPASLGAAAVQLEPTKDFSPRVTVGGVDGYSVKIPKGMITGKCRKSAGRNSSGRITIFHRGGGAKRLQRRIDVKRSTSSMGIVERIEYDPNRSARIAAVRWVEGVRLRKLSTIEEFSPPRKILEPTTTTTTRGLFSFSSLPGKVVDQKKAACLSPGPVAASVVVGRPPSFTSKDIGSKKTCVKDVFFSALSSPKAKGEAPSLSLPRIAVTGAKPSFFASQMREKLGRKTNFSLSEVQKSRANSIVWAHRIKRKAALSWQSFRQQETLGLVGSC